MNKKLRKPRGNCVLKNLPSDTQDELYAYMDGIGDENGHTYKQCKEWLMKTHGVDSNLTRLSKWRDWYITRMRFNWANDTLQMMIEAGMLPNDFTDADIQRVGNRIFSLLALRTADDKAWSRAQSLVVRRQRIAVIEKRFELDLKKYDDACARLKEREKKPEMSPEERQERIRQILSVD
jgi:hypothetical protein